MKVFLVLAALCFVLAAAQNTTVTVGSKTCHISADNACYVASYVTNKIDEYCGYCREDSGDITIFRCGNDAVCELQLDLVPLQGRCKAITVKAIGETCDPDGSHEVCRDHDWEVSCIKNANNAYVCGGVNVYGPGEDCETATQDLTVLRDGNACAHGDCTSNKCDGAAAGESCSSKYCNAGLYCNENDVCTARIPIGQACTQLDTNDHDETDGDNNGCAANADCIDGICTEYYSVAEGGKCGVIDAYANQDVCQEGLACSFKSDTAYTCISLTHEGDVCDVTNDDSCGDYYECECNFKDGTGVCIGRQNRIGTKLRAAYACLVKNNCYFDLDWFSEGCIEEDCGTEAKGVVKELQSAGKEVALLTGTPQSGSSGSSDASLTHALSAVLLAACAAVALVL